MKPSSKILCLLASSLACSVMSENAYTQNLLAHYSFEGATGSNIPDVSGNDRDASLSGSAKIKGISKKHVLDNTESAMGAAAANSGGSVRHTGAGFGKLKSFTVAMWYKTDKPLTGGTRIFDFAGIAQSFLLGANSGSGNLAVNIGQKNILVNTSPIPAINSNGSWVFVAFVFDGTNTHDNARLYLGSAMTEGRYIALGTVDFSEWNFEGEKTQFVFGANPANGRALSGYMADIRLYGDPSTGNGALDHVQLRELMTRTKPE